MRYFQYQCNDQMGSVWSMFKELSDISDYDRDPQERGRCLYGHTLETINGLMHKAEKGVSLNRDDFCLRAYELKCQRNDDTSQLDAAKKTLAIIDEAEDEEDQRIGYGQISARNLKSYEELFEAVEDMDEFNRYLQTLYNVNKVYITEEGVDLVVMLKSALRGIPMAVDSLKQIIKKDSKVNTIVCKLCENSSDGYLLRQLESSVAFN